MNSSKENYIWGREENMKEQPFFIEDSVSSESDEETRFMKDERSTKRFSRLSRGRSPPLLLAFSIASGKTQQDTSSVSSAGSERQVEEDSDQPIEDWMISGGEESAEDTSIQLNLGCWDSSEDDSAEDMTDVKVKSGENIWAVSDKDKYGGPSGSRYFMVGRSSICNTCNRMGHVAKSCYFHKKCPTCVLCGVQGHIQRDCPSRPCSTCGLPSHAFNPCRVPPVWKQHCQRCGVTGHMSDACPDTWRQYHQTVKLGIPLRPRALCSFKHRSHCAHCYNCSKRGHYGHECTKRRMISGTFSSLPYVCHYDTLEDVLQQSATTLTPAKEPVSAGVSPPSQSEQLDQKMGDCYKDRPSVQGRSRTKQGAGVHLGTRKTWPERRRERREVKRSRREAQAKREGGLSRKHCCTFDDAVLPTDSYRHILHSRKQPKPPQEKKKKAEKVGKKSRKSREAERWKKRGGIKHGDLYPNCDISIGSENLSSPKQRVRHRRR